MQLFYLLLKKTLSDAPPLLYLELLGEVVGHDGGKGGKQGSQEDANITDVDGDVEEMEDMV